MKKYLLHFSQDNDISLSWDMAQDKFILSVAANRIPIEECSLKSVATLSDYISRLQRSLRPIGKSSDGAHKNLNSWDEVLSEITVISQEGYRVNKNNLEKAHAEYICAKKSFAESWTEKKKIMKKSVAQTKSRTKVERDNCTDIVTGSPGPKRSKASS